MTYDMKTDPKDTPPPWKRPIAATYWYPDDSERRFQVVRFGDGLSPRFLQRRPNGKDRWVWNVKGITLCLFHETSLPAAIEAGRWIFCVEGEKDVLTLEKYGLIATTNPMGAGKWLPQYSARLGGARVGVPPDNDAAGEAHAAKVAAALQGVAAEVKIIRLPGLRPKGDVSDWLAAGSSPEDLKSLTLSTPPWKPQPAEKEPTGSSPDDGARPPEFSDAALALTFAERHGDELLYVAAWSRWFRWIGSHWAADETLFAVELTRRVCSERASDLEAVLLENRKSPAQARNVASAKTIGGVERLARALPDHAATSAQFDCDPWAFNALGRTAYLEEK